MMEVNFDDMSSDERVTYLVNGLSNLLLNISLTARKTLRPLGFTPENATQWELLRMIEGVRFGQHDTSGAMDWLDHLRATLEREGMYQPEDEDEEESEEDESDEFEGVEA